MYLGIYFLVCSAACNSQLKKSLYQIFPKVFSSFYFHTFLYLLLAERRYDLCMKNFNSRF